MRASDFEIRNYHKLDKILSRLCEMVVKGKTDRPEYYGMVAAAVLDLDNQIVARINRPGQDGKRIHAEHAAMLDYIDKYGPIPEGSIIITTLSPCNEHMDERDGPSCTSLINRSTVKKVYCGYMDPSQDDDTRQFNLMETGDQDLRRTCKQFADTFLDNIEQGVSEDSENNNPIANKIFFARSNKAPKGWSYDHIGFITQDGKQIQMSGHKGNDVYVTNAVTDDPEFPKQNIKIVSLSKPVSVPTTNSVGAENCGTFVANVLQANGIKGIDTQKIYSVFKKPQEQGVTEGLENIGKMTSLVDLPVFGGTGTSKVAITGDGRITAVVNVRGVHVPFYISTGEGGKLSVPTGMWYPFFGSGPSGYLNKGTEDSINKFYGSKVFERYASFLNRELGNLMAVQKQIPPMKKEGRSIINKDMSPMDHAEIGANPEEFKKRVNAFLAKIGDKPFYTVNTAKQSNPHGVAEARTNPEQNIKYGSGKYELIAVAEDIGDKENWAVTMTAEPKLGINPQVGISEDTPKGIYFYPLQYFMQMTNRKESLPWGDNMPYMQLFQYDRSSEMTKQTQVDPARLKQALSRYCSEELIQQVIDDPDELYDGSPYWIVYDCLSRLGKSDETNIVRWNKVLRDLGFTSVFDPGAGWIAYNEPTQGVVLDPRIIKQHKMFVNRNPTLQHRRYDMQGLADAIQWNNEYQYNLQRQRLYNHPDRTKVRLAVANSMLRPFLGKTDKEAAAMGLDKAIKAAADKVIEILKPTVAENFADGKHPEDKGDSKRHGINTKASVSSLRKTAKQGGRKGQLAHWLANMKAGHKK